MQKTASILFVLWGLSATFAFAQKTFLNTIGSTGDEQSYGMVQTADGNFVTSGFTTGLATGTLSYCSKYSSNGSLMWSKTVGYLVQEKAYALAPTSDGGVILGGEGKYCVNFNCGTDAFLIKLDASGNPQWTRGYGGIAWDDIQDVHQLSDGGYILAGNTVSYGQGSYDMYMIRTNANGDTLWTKTYGTTAVMYGEEKTANVITTNDGGFLLCGNLYKGDDNTNNNYLACLIKTSSNGTIQWAKNFYGTGMSIDKGVKVIQLTNENYMLATYSNIMIINSAGTVVTNKKLPQGFTFVGGQWGWGSIMQSIDGNFLAVGGHGGDACIFQFDASWNVLWAKKVGTGGTTNWDFFHEVTQASDGRILVSGYTASLGVGGGSNDNLVVVMDNQGNIANGCATNVSLAFGDMAVTTENRTVLSKSGFMTSSPTSTATDVMATAVNTQICSQNYVSNIDHSLEAFVSVHPNPSQGILTIESEIPISSLELFTSMGQYVLSYDMQNEPSIDLTSLAPGLYFYLIHTEKGDLTGKWIKE